MIVRPEGWSIVLAGFWNRAIFVPDWVQDRILGSEEDIEARVAFFPMLPFAYETTQVIMEIWSGRLVFKPKKLGDPKSLLFVESMALRALTELPQTPITAVGVNFGFRETNPRAYLKAIFNDLDPNELESLDWQIGERKISRRLTRDELVLNLGLTFNEGAINFDFNFHTDTESDKGASQAAVAPGRILNLKGFALDLLKQIYYLEPEDSDADGDS
jgi:hypothetical protein